jgi:hypothetical protein
MDTQGSADDPMMNGQPDTGRMGDSDSGERHGFMSSKPAPKKKRSFMHDQEM